MAISARIHGLLDAGSFYYSLLGHSTEDALRVKNKILLQNAKNIFDSLEIYRDNYKSTFPKEALKCLDNFLENFDIQKFNSNNEKLVHGYVQFALTSLVAFQSEFTYVIADTQSVALRITERAFAHLQRSIIVDDEIRNKWKAAFSVGERECEKLGSLHLLSHGIWAFKVDGGKGRTDLILNEPLSDLSIIERTSTALVLTEWKIVKQRRELESRIQEACKQTKIYSSGLLSGIELVNYRYLVMGI